MTSNLIRFKSSVERTGERNLNEFITVSRTHLTAFGSDTWDENKWEVINGKRKVVARFSSNLKPSNSYNYEPLSAPYLDFAKAYIKNSYTDRPVANLQRHMEAIRVLEEALMLAKDEADILLLDGVVLGRLHEVFMRQLPDPAARNKTGYQMQLMLNFCREEFITPGLPEWTNPYGKVKDLTITLDEKGKEYRSEKLPTTEEMMLVAEFFSRAPQLGVEAEYFSAIYAILMLAPSRASEQTVLPVDCLVWEENRAGDKTLSLRWVAAKKGKSDIKIVPSAMHDIAVEAVERLKRIGAPARIAAKYAEQNPGKFMVHSGCITPDNFPPDKPLIVEQLNAAISTNYPKLSFAGPKWLTQLLEENQGAISYNVLGKFEYEKYVEKFYQWPYVDQAKHVKVSDALLLHRENEFHADFGSRNFSFRLPTVTQINDRFAESEEKDGRTLWAKHNITLKNGTPIELPTHRARHWLSTLAERGGLDEITLANWAGRAMFRDNRHYDHRTEEEKARAVAALMIPEDANILEKIKNRIPVLFSDIGKDLDGAAIVTELGVCEHDYAIAPCQRNGDCETCKELVCIKGFSSSLEILKKREIDVWTLFQKATKDYEMKAFGADRWVSDHGWRLAHIRTKIRILENESIPDGTAVRIPEQYDPSPVKEMLLKKGLNLEVETPDTLELDSSLFRLKKE